MRKLGVGVTDSWIKYRYCTFSQNNLNVSKYWERRLIKVRFEILREVYMKITALGCDIV
jgi:hypothetical protein